MELTYQLAPVRSPLLVVLSHFQEFINSATPTHHHFCTLHRTLQAVQSTVLYCTVHYNVNAHIPLQAYFSKVKLMHANLFLYLLICWFLVATANVFFSFHETDPRAQIKIKYVF